MEAYASALAWAQAIKARKVSPLEVADAFIKASEHQNPKLNALVWSCFDQLRQQAKDAETALMQSDKDSLPPFFGVPIPIKDLSEAQGQPVRQGSQATQGQVGRIDSHVVQKMREAGFLFMGRSHAPEFGTIPVTETAAFGACRNPYDRSRTPGGSSGGAAAAVASGMAPIAHASDGGGSTRIPAACTGLVGLKPSRARVPKGPIISEVMHGFSADGCVSRTVADTAAFLDAISFYDETNWYHAPKLEASFSQMMCEAPRPLRVAVDLAGPLGGDVAQPVRDAIAKTAGFLGDMGHTIVGEASWQHVQREQLWQDFLSVWATIPAYMDGLDWQKVEPHNRLIWERSRAMSVADYVQAVLRLQAFSRATVRPFLDTYDVMLMPVLADLPPPVGWFFEQPFTTMHEVMERAAEMVPTTAWVNVTGQPAMAIPVHRDEASGMPVGVQLIAAPHREDLLLQLGHQLEAAVRWDKERPADTSA